jgi:CheY-like chemotaxis protein
VEGTYIIEATAMEKSLERVAHVRPDRQTRVYFAWRSPIMTPQHTLRQKPMLSLVDQQVLNRTKGAPKLKDAPWTTASSAKSELVAAQSRNLECCVTKMAKCVLIIDGDKTFCGFLAEILESKGFHVTWTTDGVAGHEMALRDCYDLLIIDVRMPGVLGTELAESLRKEKPGVKIVLISAFADEPLNRTAAAESTGS